MPDLTIERDVCGGMTAGQLSVKVYAESNPIPAIDNPDPQDVVFYEVFRSEPKLTGTSKYVSEVSRTPSLLQNETLIDSMDPEGSNLMGGLISDPRVMREI